MIRAHHALGSFVFLLALALLPAASQAASPLTCTSNKVYDGQGQTIDATRLSHVFNIWNAKNVIVRNYVVIGGEFTRVFDVSGSTNVLIENITIQGNAADVVNIRASNTITVRGVTADTIERYLVWCDTSNGITIDGCALTTGSRDETGIRIQYGVKNVNIINCNVHNVLNKNTALRLHDGENFRVAASSFEGQVMIGPMGGDQGGQMLTNATQRQLELARRTVNVTFEDVNIVGAACPLAGLSGFTMTGGSITAKPGRLFYGWCVTNVSWTYPDKAKLKPGDVSRPTPTGTFQGVTFIAPGKTTLNGGVNKPITPVACTLNGKPLG
jgi:hypothetical protein